MNRQKKFVVLARSPVCPCDRLAVVAGSWKRSGSDGSALMVHVVSGSAEKGLKMAKTNYVFAKRQRDLAKKQKKEEKRQRKTETQPPDVAVSIVSDPTATLSIE